MSSTLAAAPPSWTRPAGALAITAILALALFADVPTHPPGGVGAFYCGLDAMVASVSALLARHLRESRV
jgi:hypothetical protein